MIDLLDHFHQYVPSTEDGRVLERILFGGDQLTVELPVTHAQSPRLQSKEQLKKLQGIISKSEDWHARVVFHQVNFLINI